MTKPWVKTYSGGKPNYTEPIEREPILPRGGIDRQPDILNNLPIANLEQDELVYPTQPDEALINQGLLLGHKMAEVAGQHAGDKWMSEALDAVRVFALKNKYFTTEQVRFDYPDMLEPPDKRAWGAVVRLAKKQGFIEPAGWVRAESLTVHGMVVTKWESKIYTNN